MKPKIVKSMFLGGLFISPFVFWPWAKIPYEIPRIWFINRWLELLGLVTLMGLFRNRPIVVNSKIDSKLLGLVLSFFVWAAIASLIGVNFPKSVFGNSYRGDGLFTLAHLVGLFLFTTLFWRPSWQKPVFHALAVGSLAVSLLAIFGRTTFGQPNFLAGYLTVTLPFVWETFRNKWSKIAVGLPIAATIVAKSWGGLMGIMIFFTYLIGKKVSRPQQLIGVSALSVAIIFAGVYFWHTVWSRPYWSREFIPESRERIIRSVLNGARQRPLVGWGWANVDYAFESNPWPFKFERDIYLDKAHATILEILATTGIIGLTIYTCLIARGVWLARRTAVFAPLVLYLVYSQTNITSVAAEVIFWLTLGLAASRQLLSLSPKPWPPPSPAGLPLKSLFVGTKILVSQTQSNPGDTV